MYRISNEVFEKLNNLDEFVEFVCQPHNGQVSAEYGDDPDRFKSRLESFKEIIAQDLPMFSIDEILKFDQYFHEFKKIYEWYGFHGLLTALEFESEKSKLSLNS